MTRLRRIFQGLLLLVLSLGLVAGCQVLRMTSGPELGPRPDDALRLATWNVHYIWLGRETGPWSVGDWERRAPAMQTVFARLDADAVAFQEMESFGGGSGGAVNLTLDFLLERNPDFAAAAVGDHRSFPSTQPILYRRDRLEVIEQGWFFFSETPDVIYSRTFDGSYPAFASWARFRARTEGAAFRILNLHTDYASGENRRKSLDLVARRVEPWIAAGETVFVMGDFNVLAGSDLLKPLEDLGLRFVDVPGGTYHFNRGLPLFGAIDHIGFVRAEGVGRVTAVRENPGGIWPSDHFPVVADFVLPD